MAVPNNIWIEHFPDIFSDTSKLAGSKLIKFCVCLFSFQSVALTRETDLVGNVSDEKTLLK